jgi:hypothetical protein
MTKIIEKKPWLSNKAMRKNELDTLAVSGVMNNLVI